MEHVIFLDFLAVAVFLSASELSVLLGALRRLTSTTFLAFYVAEFGTTKSS